jgi:uncharacterized protein YndB with AHSA1/START domain
MTKENHVYEETVTVNAAPEVVFQALTSAAILQRWFPTRAETEQRPGGQFEYAWDFADAAQNGTQKGYYLEFEPSKKVSYTWEAAPAPAEPTTVTFTLTGQGNHTVVKLAHTGFGPGDEGKTARDHHAGPWGFYMGNLKSYLESAGDNRAAALGQKTL